MTNHRTTALLSVILAASALFALPAHAEFQALGVVATKQPITMQCQDGLCTAYLSAFCLEQTRPPPPGRTPYRPTENSRITLIVETSAGNTVRLAGRDWLRFQTRTNYTGVLAIADERRVRQLDPVRISLEVGPMVSLLPLATEVDDNRHRAAEIELAIGPYRKAAQRYFEDNTASSQALSFAVRLINALPPSGNLGKGRLKTIVADARAHLDRQFRSPKHAQRSSAS